MSGPTDRRPEDAPDALALLGRVWGATDPSRETGGHDPAASTDHPTGDPDATADRPTKSPPTSNPLTPTVGRFILHRPLGAGGFGLVFAATDPTLGRQVALKVARPEYAFDPTGRDRFLAEAQLAGGLNHPGLVRVLEAGDAAGVWYIASELCDGPDLAGWLRARTDPVPPRAAAALVMRIAQAVGAAHVAGLMHRDLKPANVLLVRPPNPADPPAELLPDGWVPKVTDFGLAKLIEGGVDRTRSGAVAGTPQYMAPEQASGERHLTPAADVWALGVILYEVLTDVSPFRGESVVDTLRRVCETEPVTPRRLRSGLPRDLDTICLKCLHKEPARRYATAADLAADLGSLLAGRAVLARPVGRVEKGWLWCRRNPAATALLALLAVAATVSGGLAWQSHLNYRTAEANRQLAEQERDDAQVARGQAQAAKLDAEKNLAFAKEGNAILGSVFAGLDPNRNSATLGELTQSLRSNVTDAVRRLDGAAVGDPLDLARMQHTLASSLYGLGDAAGAITLFEKAHDTRTATLGPDHPDTLDSAAGLALSCQTAGRLERAIRLHLDTLERMKRALEPDAPATLGEMNNLALCHQAQGRYDLSVPILEDTLARRKARLGPDHADVPATITNLAVGYERSGQLAKALPLYEEAATLLTARYGSDHSFTLNGVNNLALGHQAMGRLELALPLLKRVLDRRTARLGADHPDTLVSLNNLAMNYQLAKQFEKSVPLYEQSLRRMTVVNAPNHPTTLTVRNNLALGYRGLGQFDKALTQLEETYTLWKAELGPHHRSTLMSKANLAAGYKAAGQLDKALKLNQETLDEMISHLGADDPYTMTIRNNLAVSYAQAKQYDKALPLLKATLDLRKAKLPPAHPDILVSLNNLAKTYRNAGQPEQAVPLYEEAFALSMANGGPDNPATLTAMNNLGQTYCGVRNGPKAVAAYTPYVEGQRRLLAADPPRLAELLAGVAVELSRADQFVLAESLLRECLTLREKAEPDAWTLFNTQSLLGAALLGQKKSADAEPLLLKGYEGMKAREKTIPPQANTRIPEALDRLIELYTATNKPDEVKKWQEVKAKLPKPEAPKPPEKK